MEERILLPQYPSSFSTRWTKCIEAYAAAYKLASQVLRVKQGEEVVVTVDTEGDAELALLIAGACYALGAKPLVFYAPAARGVGKAADPDLPVKVLSAALREADVWIDLSNKWFLYSTPWEHAVAENPKLRYMCLVGAYTDMLVRTIGRVDLDLLREVLHKVAELTRKARKVEMETSAGTSLAFENDPRNPVTVDAGEAWKPGDHYLPGQIGWTPKLESIEGTIVFDGSLYPPVGLLEEPVKLEVRKGKVIEVTGGRDAEAFKAWLDGFHDERMYRIAHVCYGLNPGAMLTGNILEDEKVWGAVEFGLGYVSPSLLPPSGLDAPSHTDGVCLNATVWLDGEKLLDKGRLVHPDLEGVEEKLLARARG